MSETLTPYRAAGGGLLVVGIDPGAVTGVAVWDAGAGRLEHVGSGRFFEVLDGVASMPSRPALVVLEDARRLPVFARHDRVRGRRRDRLCRRVGYVDRDVELWEAWLRREGLRYRLAVPSGRKWDAARLRALTGWAAPTNQHGRDAARLVVGATARHVEIWGGRAAPAEVVP